MSWNIINSDRDNPLRDGRYAVIYRQGRVVRPFIGDYSVVDGWMTGMPDVQILAWLALPKVPEEMRQK